MALVLDGYNVTLDQLVAAGNNPAIQVSVKDENWAKIAECRKLVDEFTDSGQVIYGVNTSCGGLVSYLLPRDAVATFQKNLIRCVSTQVGPEFSDAITRTAMIARVNSLCRGYSGINPENLKILLQMINKNVIPIVKQKGSLGTSGDLGPLAMIALAATGEWCAKYQGAVLPAAEAMAKAGIPLMKLSSKEGLSLINGTSFMVAVASHVLVSAQASLFAAAAIGALTLEVLKGRLNPYDLRVHKQKYHPGQYAVARNMMVLAKGSGLVVDEINLSTDLKGRMEARKECFNAGDPMEDAYSLRCIPQYLGPTHEALSNAKATLTRELNSSNDNPLIFTEFSSFIHNGNFHGQPISMAMDMLATAMTCVSVISDRRIDRFMDNAHSCGLPEFLCKEQTGIRMGLMGGQFMTSSLVAENRTLCVPACVQSVPSTADFQDVVSFGLIAGRKALEVVKNVNYVLSFEAICAAQAADIRGVDKLSPAGRATYNLIRKMTPYQDQDRVMTPDMEAISEAINQDMFNKAVLEITKTPLWLVHDGVTES